MTKKKDASASPAANAMWGGRFSEAPSDVMQRFNASIGFDQRLAKEDIAGSRAHARMLATQGIISEEDKDNILGGLDQIEKEIAEGSFAFSEVLEDIHMNIESRLSDLIGEAAGRLHTGRSRNDQVATDFKLWVRGTLDGLVEATRDWQRALVALASKHTDSVMPGFTHLQPATPVSFAHHLLAYAEMAERDLGRYRDARVRLNECPLGAAALAGTSHPIDREMTAKELGFDRPAANSLDAVSSRDFALEALSAATLGALTLSRFAEEIIVWSTPAFGFVKCSDQFSTGSSIMPQKRNPDAAELLRGKTGRVLGGFNTLSVTMKGLPLAYSKDMQEDKEPVFDALDTLGACLTIAAGVTESLQVNTAAMRSAAGVGYTTAVDLADWLVRELNMPFREAHHVVGRLVAQAEKTGTPLHRLSSKELKSAHPGVDERIRDVVTPDSSLAARKHVGGPAPEAVRRELEKWQTRLSQ